MIKTRMTRVSSELDDLIEQAKREYEKDQKKKISKTKITRLLAKKIKENKIII